MTRQYYTIYGKPQCTFCKQAKDLLESKGLHYDYYDISECPTSRHYVVNVLKARTVPQILRAVPLEHIGGFQELKALIDQEESYDDIWN